MKKLYRAFASLLLVSASIFAFASPAQADGCYVHSVNTSTHSYWTEGRLVWSDWVWRTATVNICTNIWGSGYRTAGVGTPTCANVRVHWETGLRGPWVWLCSGASIIDSKYGYDVRFYIENCGYNDPAGDIAPGTLDIQY